MELISNATLVKCQHCGQATNFAGQEHYQQLRARHAQLEQTSIKWIGVFSAVPDDETTVLLCFAGDADSITVGHRCNNAWWDEDSRRIRTPITHWAELPATPEA